MLNPCLELVLIDGPLYVIVMLELDEPSSIAFSAPFSMILMLLAATSVRLCSLTLVLCHLWPDAKLPRTRDPCLFFHDVLLRRLVYPNDFPVSESVELLEVSEPLRGAEVHIELKMLSPFGTLL